MGPPGSTVTVPSLPLASRAAAVSDSAALDVGWQLRVRGDVAIGVDAKDERVAGQGGKGLWSG